MSSFIEMSDYISSNNNNNNQSNNKKNDDENIPNTATTSLLLENDDIYHPTTGATVMASTTATATTASSSIPTTIEEMNKILFRKLYCRNKNKQGHCYCYCCCDMRKAVIIINFFILFNACSTIGITFELFNMNELLLIPKYNMTQTYSTTTNSTTTTTNDEYYYYKSTSYIQAWMAQLQIKNIYYILLIQFIIILFSCVGMKGAYTYNKKYIVIATIYYCIYLLYLCIVSIVHNEANSIPFIVLYCLCIYPHIFFLKELYTNIMTSDNYKNEDQHCACCC